MKALRETEIMSRHVDALFTHDSDGRIRAVNDPESAIAPRFFLGRTAAGNVWRFRFDVPDDLVDELERLCLEEPAAGESSHIPVFFDEYVKLLEKHSPAQRVWSGPAYIFPDTVGETFEDLVCITNANAGVLKGGFEDWIRDIQRGGPFIAFLREGQAVSLCCSVRITPDAHEAGVETLKAHRGNGYASKVVATWADEVRKLGAEPLYSTSWENTSSQNVAKRLGLIPYGTDFNIA